MAEGTQNNSWVESYLEALVRSATVPLCASCGPWTAVRGAWLRFHILNGTFDTYSAAASALSVLP